MKTTMEAAGATYKMIDLGRDAHVLVIRNGIRHIVQSRRHFDRTKSLGMG
jgi:hypothetical protein